jgi:hypothetical protein
MQHDPDRRASHTASFLAESCRRITDDLIAPLLRGADGDDFRGLAGTAAQILEAAVEFCQSEFPDE